MPRTDFISSGHLVSAEAAREQCQHYLSIVAQVTGQTQQPSSSRLGQEQLAQIPTTIGTLVVVTEYMESCFDIGMIHEGTELLRRLTGLPKHQVGASEQSVESIH